MEKIFEAWDWIGEKNYKEEAKSFGLKKRYASKNSKQKSDNFFLCFLPIFLT